MKRIFTLLSLIVFTACAEDEPSASFSIQEPFIISEEEHLQGRFTDFEAQNSYQLSTKDSLSFENTKIDFDLEVTVSCEFLEGQAYTANWKVVRPKKVSLQSLLPKEYINHLNQTQPVFCEFTFFAKAYDGSEHQFKWDKQSIKIMKSPFNFVYKKDLQELEEAELISYQNFSDYYLRQLKGRNYQLDCGKLLNTSITNLSIAWNSSQISYLKETNFKCHILELEAWGGVRNYSPLFYLTRGTRGLDIADESKSLELHTTNAPYKTFAWKLYNNSTDIKLLKIYPNFKHLEINYVETKLNNSGVQYKTNFTQFLSPMNVYPTSEVKLSPGETKTIYLQTVRPKHCDSPMSGVLVNAKYGDALIIEEFSPSSTELNYQSALARHMYFLPQQQWLAGKSAKGTTYTAQKTPYPKKFPQSLTRKCN